LFNKVRRNAFLIAAAFFLWQGWSALQAKAPAEEAKAQLPLPKLEASYLRGPDSPLPAFDALMGDRQPAAELGPDGAPAAGSLAGVGDPFHMMRNSLAKQEEAMAELGVAAQPSGVVESALAVRPQAVLQLQSTLKPPHGAATAIINGHILSVGEALPSFDEDHPPVLIEVSGTKAILRYDGQQITLDVAGTASVSVDR